MQCNVSNTKLEISSKDMWPKLTNMLCRSVQNKTTIISRVPTNSPKMHIRIASSHPNSL
jgi:hypothetical protein